jgi:hypothetical protein
LREAGSIAGGPRKINVALNYNRLVVRETFNLKRGEAMKRQSMAIAETIILVLALASVVTAADPIIGTWKLNLAKSKTSPIPEFAPNF